MTRLVRYHRESNDLKRLGCTQKSILVLKTYQVLKNRSGTVAAYQRATDFGKFQDGARPYWLSAALSSFNQQGSTEAAVS